MATRFAKHKSIKTLFAGDENEVKLKKAREIATDTVSAAAETSVELALDNLPILTTAMSEAGLQGAANILADSVVGAIAPGALGLVVNYRLNRMQRNIKHLIDELASNMDIVNNRLDSLEPVVRSKFVEGPYRDAFLDGVINENEPRKVSQDVNAFVNLMAEENPSDSFAITLFDDLSRMSELDVRVLKLHYHNPLTGFESEDDYLKLISEEGIDDSQYRSIREKLCRLGLLSSRNEKKREENLEAVQKAVTELLKQLDKRNPKLPKPPRIQNTSRLDSFSITPLGRHYLELIRPISGNQTDLPKS